MLDMHEMHTSAAWRSHACPRRGPVAAAAGKRKAAAAAPSRTLGKVARLKLLTSSLSSRMQGRQPLSEAPSDSPAAPGPAPTNRIQSATAGSSTLEQPTAAVLPEQDGSTTVPQCGAALQEAGAPAAREEPGATARAAADDADEPEAQGMKSNIILMLRRRRRDKDQGPEELPPMRGTHPALQLMRQRANAGSLPKQRTDEFKLGLVIEGGGMRGAVSAGGLLELGNLGLRECFDAVYGSSAGAINATYFLSGQREGVRVYCDDIANKQFLDLGRLLQRGAQTGPVMDLSFLLDYVLEYVKPLDWDAVLASPIDFKVIASSLDTLEPVMLDGFQSKADLVACLKASANVPKIAGDPVLHRGQRLVDAAVFEAVPWRAAIADGCTHIVTLCTRPASRAGRVRKAMSGLFEGAVKKVVLSPDYMKAAWAKELATMTADGMTGDEMLLMALDEGAEALPFFAGAHCYPVYPGDGAKYAPVCIDRTTLMRGIEEGRQAVRRVMQPYSRHADSQFAPIEVPELSPVQQQLLAAQRLLREASELQERIEEQEAAGSTPVAAKR